MTSKPDTPVWVSDSGDAKLFNPTPNQRLVGRLLNDYATRAGRADQALH